MVIKVEPESVDHSAISVELALCCTSYKCRKTPQTPSPRTVSPGGAMEHEPEFIHFFKAPKHLHDV